MNLRKVTFWKEPAIAAPSPLVNANTFAVGEAEQPAQPMPAASNQLNLHTAKVIQLPRPEAAAVCGEAPLADELVKAPPLPQRVKGLMNSPELGALFRINKFRFGRHHGSHNRTQEALDRGLLAVVPSYQNIVADLAERRQVRVDKLQQSHQELARHSPPMANPMPGLRAGTERDCRAQRAPRPGRGRGQEDVGVHNVLMGSRE